MQRNWFIEVISFLAVFVLVFYTAWTIRGAYELQGAIQYYPHYIYDSIPYEVPVKVEVEKPVYRSIPTEIDSHAVALAYFAEYPFKFHGDTNEVAISAKGIISQNQILSLEVEVVNTRPTEIILPEPSHEVSAGMLLSNNLLAPSISFRKGRWTYGLGYDLLPNNQVGLLLDLKYRIKQW